MLDGILLAARIVAAHHAHLYVSDPHSAAAVAAALQQLGAADTVDGLTIDIRVVEPGYVAGEETAAVRALNGGPAKPTDKPPRPFEEGVAGAPTLISNVETLANLPYIHRHGAQDYRSAGTSGSAGTFLATVTGGGRPPGLYELPFGVAATEVLAVHGVSLESVRGVLIGGASRAEPGGARHHAGPPHPTLRGLGSGLGCGAISVVADECPSPSPHRC